MPPETLAQISVRMPPFSQFDFERAASPMREGGGGSGAFGNFGPRSGSIGPASMSTWVGSNSTRSFSTAMPPHCFETAVGDQTLSATNLPAV